MKPLPKKYCVNTNRIPPGLARLNVYQHQNKSRVIILILFLQLKLVFLSGFHTNKNISLYTDLMLRSASQLMIVDVNRFSGDCPSRHQKNFMQLHLGQQVLNCSLLCLCSILSVTHYSAQTSCATGCISLYVGLFTSDAYRLCLLIRF